MDVPHALDAVATRPDVTAVLLDLDGTLAPIVEMPDDVRILPAIRKLLPILRSRYALVAFVSGRALTELRRIVDLEGVAYSGNHGVEVQLPNGRILPEAAPHAARVRLGAFASSWAETELRRAGIRLENKGATLTFHYRTAADRDAAERFLAERVVPAATAMELAAEPGRMSVEIHPSGTVDKGTAANALLDVNPTLRQVLSVGDDRTDVRVWRAMRQRIADHRLDLALAVGVDSDECPDEVRDEADHLVDGVAGAARLLRRLTGHAAG